MEYKNSLKCAILPDSERTNLYTHTTNYYSIDLTGGLTFHVAHAALSIVTASAFSPLTDLLYNRVSLIFIRQSVFTQYIVPNIMPVYYYY